MAIRYPMTGFTRDSECNFFKLAERNTFCHGKDDIVITRAVVAALL